ncbi:hypothetical protein KHA80_11840 [Anaerobacillus sp. HL2]|nr:hypothetical protein KHA80_11840 [Anaerobacillus sp. HL2]
MKLILSGEYFRQYEEFFSDQFIGREYWVSGYRQSELVKSKIIAKAKGSDVQNIDNFHNE